MNKPARYIITIVFSLLGSIPISGNINWDPIKKLSSADNLPTDEIKSVYQGKDGYIWIATLDGLCRYDGYSVKTYKNNLYAPDLLSSNEINVVQEDENNNIWIGTTGGINVYNKKTGEIRQVGQGVLGEKVEVQDIITTKNKEVWVGTSKGILRYISSEDSFVYYTNALTDYNLRGNDIKSLEEDKRGQIWIGTWNEGLTRFDPQQERFIPYPQINERNSAHFIFADKENNLWVGSWGYGLFRVENPYDLDEVEYKNFQHVPDDPKSLSDDIVYTITQNKRDGKIWIGTRSGLSIMSIEGNSVYFENHLPENHNGEIMYNEVNSIIQDKSGLMWLGSLGGGISLIDTQEKAFKSNNLREVLSKKSSNWVRCLYIDKEGQIWMGIGSMGLVKYSPSFDRYEYFDNHPDFGHYSIKGTVLHVMQPHNSNEYWIGTYGEGIYVYHPFSADNEKVRNITADVNSWLNSDLIYYLKEDNAGYLWIGTGNGISIYDPKQDIGV